MPDPQADGAPQTPVRRNLVLFLVAMSLLSAAGGMYETTFNNYVSDAFRVSAAQRGALEVPRELPGLLTALMVAGLVLLAETRVAAIAAFATGAGLLALAWGQGQSWNTMLLALMVWSIGTHLIMPVRSSIAMELAHGAERGKRLGQISGVGVAASVAGCGIVWVLMRGAEHNYRLVFALGGVLALVAGVVLLAMRMPGAHLTRQRFVWNRRYWLYYTLSFLFGARKQIFITFGPWVLIRVFGQKPVIFAQLWIVASVLGMLFQPMLGRAIDRFGERLVLMADALLIALICVGYGYGHLLGNRSLALGMLYSCFVLDQLLFGTGMARDTYLSKIAVRKEDVAPTLSLGVSINHLVSMSIPFAGGLLWMRYGHGAVFACAAVVAAIMFFFASRLTTAQAPSHAIAPAT
jgi:MFS family permease